MTVHVALRLMSTTAISKPPERDKGKAMPAQEVLTMLRIKMAMAMIGDRHHRFRCAIVRHEEGDLESIRRGKEVYEQRTSVRVRVLRVFSGDCMQPRGQAAIMLIPAQTPPLRLPRRGSSLLHRRR